MKIIHVLASYENYLGPIGYIPIFCDAKLLWQADGERWNDRWVAKENAYAYCEDDGYQLCKDCEQHPDFALFVLAVVG